MSVSNRIVALRESRNLTQKELSDKLGINRSVLNRIERGTRPVRDDELKAFADFFDVSADYLIGSGKGNTSAFNEEETKLLDGYRELNDADKNFILGMIGRLSFSRASAGIKTAAI